HLVSYDELRELRGASAPTEPRRYPLDHGNIEKIASGLWAVVNEGGTGVRGRIPGYDVIGKTGSAQVASAEFAKGKKETELKDKGWFVGAVSRDHPEIVVSAVFEHAEHGFLAAPVVRDVLKAYLDKQIRKQITERREKPVVTGQLRLVQP